MSAPDRLDNSLNRLLADLAVRLAGAGDGQVLVGAEDLGTADPDCLGILCAAGLLTESEPAAGTICDGCDRACPMEVKIVPKRVGSPRRAFVVCDKRDDIGRVPVEMDRLRRWRASVDEIAEVTAALIGTDRPPRRLQSGLVWSLGFMDHGNQPIEIFLDATGTDDLANPGLTITLCEVPELRSGPIVELSRLVAFRNHRLDVAKSVLEHGLISRLDDRRIACEITYERRNIVLVNHVTGVRRAIARPRFDSPNDNAFQVLFDNPGRRFALEELRAVTDQHATPDLHKMVENLKFDGVLKELFFDVSKSAIRFERTVTRGQLASLGIDPKTIA